MGKKKMSKEERKKYEAEKAEALRIEAEKERQRQLEEERCQKLKQLSDARERQKREIRENKMRRVQLAESCEFFKKIRQEIDDIHAEDRKLKEWNRYMRCNGLPNAYDPGDLRKYIHMWQLECDRYNQNEQNWLLRTDERTILTQNRNIQNETRVYLQQQQANLGDLYAKRTHNVLGILEEIDEGVEMSTTLKQTIVEELNRLKLEFRLKLTEYIDDFSFKILSNIDRDMKLEGLLIATHFYECDVFKAHLWTKRDIPQPLLNEKERQKEAKSFISIDFPSIRLNLSLPPSVKCKSGAIRGMWLNYDHFSDFCPSFKMPGETVIKRDLNQAAKREWRKRKEMEKTARVETESKPAAAANSSIGAVPFDNFELLNIPIVDIDKLYMDYVNDIMQKDRLRKGPQALKLKEFEVNLRHYRIVGGIYCLDYFEKPEQCVKLSSKSYLRTVSSSKTLKRRQFFQYFRTPEPTPAGVRRLPEEIETEMKAVERGLSKLSYVTITLPDDIIWFEPPTVCRWETVAETEVSEQIENKSANGESTVVYQRPVKMVSRKVQPSHVNIVDFNLLRIPSNVDINFIIKEIIVPRLPDGYTIALSEPMYRPSSGKIELFTIEKQSIYSQDPAQINGANDFLIATNSPRQLHPTRKLKFNVHILDRKVDDSKLNACEYLFSKLLQDLDDLSDKQQPLIEKQMDEISENLSASLSDAASDSDAQLNADDSFQRIEEFPWQLTRRGTMPDITPQAIEPDESDDDDVGDDDEMDGSDHEQSSIGKSQQNVIGRWSTRDIHDPKFNEEKLAIQFRAGRMGSFGLAVNWYANLPFQTWECKPDVKKRGHIFYSLTASVVSLDITITESGIILNSFQGGTTPQIQDAIGTTMSFQELKRLLFKSGINLFPDKDFQLNLSNFNLCGDCAAVCEKDTIMEFHLYDCMAHLGLTHNFMWSRWNSQLNCRSMALLVREIIEKRKTPTFSTLFVTPLKAYLVESTEVSTSFNATALQDMNQRFFADLYHLSKEISQPASIEKQMSMSPLLRYNMLQVLKATRPLSLS